MPPVRASNASPGSGKNPSRRPGRDRRAQRNARAEHEHDREHGCRERRVGARAAARRRRDPRSRWVGSPPRSGSPVPRSPTVRRAPLRSPLSDERPAARASLPQPTRAQTRPPGSAQRHPPRHLRRSIGRDAHGGRGPRGDRARARSGSPPRTGPSSQSQAPLDGAVIRKVPIGALMATGPDISITQPSTGPRPARSTTAGAVVLAGSRVDTWSERHGLAATKHDIGALTGVLTLP